MTLAAFELQNTNIKVIDLALKYGYESPEAFTRAFQTLHGITPTSARNMGVNFKAYPRISFQISIKGDLEMNYRIENLHAFSAVGVRHGVSMENAFSLIPRIWQEMGQSEIGNKLFKLIDENSNKQLSGIIGILSEGDWGKKDDLIYYTAAPYEKEAPVDMEKVSFPESQWVVFEVPTLGDMPKSWRSLYDQWVPTSGYALADLPAIECYYPPGHNPQNELWIPISKK